MDALWYLYVGSTVILFLACLLRFSDPLHPGVALPLALFAQLLGDFIIRAGPNWRIDLLHESDLDYYRLAILILVWVLTGFPLLICPPQPRPRGPEKPLPVRASWIAAIFGSLMTAGEVVRVLDSVDFSFGRLLEQFLLPRNEMLWNVDGLAIKNPLITVSRQVMPIGMACLFVTLIAGSRLLPRIFSAIFFIVGAPILVIEGIRTWLIIVGAAGIFASFAARRGIWRWAGVIAIVGMVGAGVLFQASTRSIGIAEFLSAGSDFSGFGLYFDDTHSWVVWAMYLSDLGAKWDPWFFFESIVFNPIPRVVWPERPVLTEAFFGDFKPTYITTSALGELIACFGVEAGFFFFAILYFFLFYILLRLHQTKRKDIWSILQYVILAFWFYSIIRSLQNITAIAPLILTVVIFRTAVGRLSRASRPVLFRYRRQDPLA